MFRIEQRVGIAASVDDVYEIVADIDNWPNWSPIHKSASGKLSFGAPIGFEEYFEGLGTWEIQGTLADWTPLSHIHVAVPKPFYTGTLIRYFEFDALSAAGSTFAVGAMFNGFLAEREGRQIAKPVKRGFEAFAEALKVKAEAEYAAKPESERTRASNLPPEQPRKLEPPKRQNWHQNAFFGKKKK